MEFIQSIEDAMFSDKITETLIEINFFLYMYKKGASRIEYNGEDYLCLFVHSHIYPHAELTEEEKTKITESYHIYLISYGAFSYVDDLLIRKKIIEEYKKREGKNGENVCKIEESSIRYLDDTDWD